MPPMSPIVCTAEVSPESGFLATRVHNVAWGTGSGDPVDLVLGGLRSRLDHQLVDVHVRRTGRDPRNRIGHVLGHERIRYAGIDRIRLGLVAVEADQDRKSTRLNSSH